MKQHPLVKAVVFDIGGVLERVVGGPEAFLGRWKKRLRMTDEQFDAAVGRVDRDAPPTRVPALTGAEYRLCWMEALGLSDSQADAFMQDLWDWYCGELDTELVSFAAGLSPRYATAILSNSGPGAREEEEARYGFSQIFDPIVYSHEVGMMKPDPAIYALTCELLHVEPEQVVFLDDWQVAVDGANDFGMSGILHQSTPSSIQAINALLA